jgi:phosphate transport system substrate-binding protein
MASLFFVSFNSCKKQKAGDGWDDTLTSGVINIACDESFKSLINSEVPVFEAHHPGAIIFPIYANEAEVIKLLIADSVRLAISTRGLNSKEEEEIVKKSMKVSKHIIAFDGIALIVNKLNENTMMGLPVLKKIITGEITQWSDLNAASHLGTIRVLFDNKESGVLRYTVDSISQGTALSPNLYALNSSEELIDKVAEMPNTIGLIGINGLSMVRDSARMKQLDKIQMVRLSKEENPTKANSYLPYAGDIVQENYPLWRPVYTLLSDPRSGLSSGFAFFLTTEVGQKVILKSGLLPVTDPHIIPVTY